MINAWEVDMEDADPAPETARIGTDAILRIDADGRPFAVTLQDLADFVAS